MQQKRLVYFFPLRRHLFSRLPKGMGWKNYNSLNPIANLFYSNEIAAIDKYNGSYVQVNGKIGKIDSREGVIVVESGDWHSVLV